MQNWDVPTLTLVRDHPSDIAHRLAIMSIDGKEVARLKFKERKEIQVAPGRHTIQGKNELGKTTTFVVEVAEGKDLTVHVGGIPIGCFSIFAGIFPPTPEIVMQLEPWQGGGQKWK